MSIVRTSGLFLSLGALVWLSGCASAPTTRVVDEYRYRIFFASAPLETVDTLASDEQLDRVFEPKRAVSAAVREFQREGFALDWVQSLGWGRGATILAFKRSHRTAEPRPAPPPQSMVGLYARYDDEGEPTEFFALTPDGADFLVQHISQTGLTQSVGRWERDALVWDEGDRFYRASLEGRGDVLKISSGEPGTSGSELAARRLEVDRTLSAEERRAQKYLIGLKRWTFPW